MTHPFIVKLHYAFQSETRLFIVMDFCKGGDLGGMLDKHKKFSEDVAKIYIA
jgi:serine/threonine protein kinase